MGQLGDGSLVSRVTPEKVSELKDIVNISSSDMHSLAVDKNGTVWTWGENSQGQLGYGAVLNEDQFVQCMTYGSKDGELANLVKVSINGELLVFDVLPLSADGTVFVPMRKIFEALGATVKWDNNSKTVTGIKGNTTINLTIGSSVAMIDGKKQQLEAPAFSCEGNMMVPARFISESLGAKVEWDKYTKTVVITN